MIVTSIGGGIGNQMFCYSFGRYLAYKHNTEFKLQVPTNTKTHHGDNKLGNFNIIENYATEEEILKTRENNFVTDRNFGFIAGLFVPKLFESPDNSYTLGIFQNEKYFSDIREILLKEFTLKNPLHKNSAQWKKKILAADCAVSLHIRRGDYLRPNEKINHGMLTAEYYKTCVNELKKDFPEMTIFIFSDDMDYVKSNFKFDVSTEFVEGCEEDFEELYLMSICKHNIIPNSTFAWWGAWLNQNSDKKVFAPDPWFRYLPDGTSPVCESWIKIPADYDKNLYAEIPPILSIILLADDNAKNLLLILQSMLVQSFNDYEIVLIDTSKNNFCRQFAADKRVNYIKVNRPADKNEILNMALECAAGSYILFLTDKSFIFPHATALLVQCWNYDFDKNFNNRNKYINSKNYDEVGADIICSIQRVEEDDNGINIAGIPDKKFILKTDESFKNLNGIIEIKIDDSQKLIGLATQQINNSLATKFFKRKFLMENKIRFKNNPGGGVTTFFGRKFHEYR